MLECNLPGTLYVAQTSLKLVTPGLASGVAGILGMLHHRWWDPPAFNIPSFVYYSFCLVRNVPSSQELFNMAGDIECASNTHGPRFDPQHPLATHTPKRKQKRIQQMMFGNTSKSWRHTPHSKPSVSSTTTDSQLDAMVYPMPSCPPRVASLAF